MLSVSTRSWVRNGGYPVSGPDFQTDLLNDRPRKLKASTREAFKLFTLRRPKKE